MIDPYATLGVQPQDDDETIRRRYLELVRQYTPATHPDKFTVIRAAYDSIKDIEARVRFRLFEQGKRDNIEDIIHEITTKTPRQRQSLQSLLAAQKPSAR